MNAPERIFIADLRNIAIDEVGIKGLRYPLALATRDGLQHTIAEIDPAVALPPEIKGTHMSRFVELIEAWSPPLGAASLADLAHAMLVWLDAERVQARSGAAAAENFESIHNHSAFARIARRK